MISLPGYGGPEDRLVRLICTEPPHDGDGHFDETYNLAFGAAHVAAIS